ncbi:MAG: TRAP transporter small permease [Saprospiraceae bacterium]|nr:TRAP transporter small permease [Lewinella sp.]
MRARIDKIVGNFLVLLMAVITLDVLWGVFTRYILGDQASWSEELARFLLIWIGVLGAAYASGQRMHLAIDLLGPKLEPHKHRRLQRFIDLLILLFALSVLLVGGLRLLYITQVLGQLSPSLRVPMAVVYSVLPISGLLIVYYKILDIQAKEI